MREYLDLCRRGEDTIADRLELLLTHRVVAAQLDEMTKSLAAIDFTIATYQGPQPNEERQATQS